MNIAIWIIFAFSVLFWCVDLYLFSMVIPHWEGMLKTVDQRLPILTMLVLQLATVRHFFVLPIAIQLTAGVILKNAKGLALQIVGLVAAFSLIVFSFLGPYLAIYQLSR